jgi:large subunit ribosomal protein L24
MKIKKGDNVIIIAGSHKGKNGKVIKAIPALNKVVVEGINTVKKNIKSKTKGKAGSVVDVAMPIHVSNVAKKD